MADEKPAKTPQAIPVLTDEQKKITQAQFVKARESIAGGQLDYAIAMLLTCCKLDPANIPYRQLLRRTQKDKYKNNKRGSSLAFFTTPSLKAKLKSAKRSRDYLRALEYGEQVLCKNPWDLGAQLDMAEAFDALRLLDLAKYTLDQAREKYPNDSTLNRAMARICEKSGDFKMAIGLWQLVLKKNPRDLEAQHKAQDLAASETIAKGGYVEAAAGSKESPVMGKIESRAIEKQQDRAAKEAEPILKRLEATPTEPSLYVQLSSIYRKYGQLDRARAVLQQGLGPTGNAYQLVMELKDLELTPHRKKLDEIDARIRKIRERTKARAANEEIEDDEPDELSEKELLQELAKVLKDINTGEIEIFRIKVERFPNDPLHRIELGTRLLKADRLDEAIEVLQQAKRDEKLKWKASMLLGLAFKKKNNWRLAQRNFEEALQVVPANDDAGRKELLYQLACGCAENGDLPRAIDLGNELANLDFGYKNIGKLLDEWNDRGSAA